MIEINRGQYRTSPKGDWSPLPEGRTLEGIPEIRRYRKLAYVEVADEGEAAEDGTLIRARVEIEHEAEDLVQERPAREWIRALWDGSRLVVWTEDRQTEGLCPDWIQELEELG